jgi:endo-1,4-beta-D-glucanase Y
MAVRYLRAPAALAFGATVLAGLSSGVCEAAQTGMTAATHTCASHLADWPQYRIFVERFIQADGRVIDYSTPAQQTTSEGQSYAMFFALVANDRATFERLLAWTRTNLADNRFDATGVRLPAWQWGKRPDGSYGVLDPNSAADADLWIAYDLLQAGRLWHEPAYTELGEALAKEIERSEIVDLPRLGPMLLPGPQGFVNGDVTRLNPSYLPLPLLRGLAHDLSTAPWTQLAANGFKLVSTTSPRGFSPDWAAWRAGQFVVDPKSGDTGSYDAIRVYLWAGLASPADPLAKRWLAAIGGMREHVARTGMPPERVATMSAATSGEAPLSYWGALAPYFKALGDDHALGLARVHLAALETADSNGHDPVYYDRVLGLFGSGSIEGRYRFDEAGRLVPAWRSQCD